MYCEFWYCEGYLTCINAAKADRAAALSTARSTAASGWDTACAGLEADYKDCEDQYVNCVGSLPEAYCIEQKNACRGLARSFCASQQVAVYNVYAASVDVANAAYTAATGECCKPCPAFEFEWPSAALATPGRRRHCYATTAATAVPTEYVTVMKVRPTVVAGVPTVMTPMMLVPASM